MKAIRELGGVSAQTRRVVWTTQEEQSTRTVGGVRRARGLDTDFSRAGTDAPTVDSSAGPVSGPAHPDFVYHGGPVIRYPLIYGSFWGSLWQEQDHIRQAERLSQFLTDLVNSTYMNVLSQYGVGNGPGSGSFMQNSFISKVPKVLKDSDIRNVIRSAINLGAIPEPPKDNKTNVLIIFLDESTTVDDPDLKIRMCTPRDDNSFGYHLHFNLAGNPFYYAVIPALTDECLKNSSSNDSSDSLHLSQTQEERRTQVTSHEFIEMCTDPEFSEGWWGERSDENGDICNGEPDIITVGQNTWTVQQQYSKFNDLSTNGAVFRVTTAPNPIPRLSRGPSGVAAGPMQFGPSTAGDQGGTNSGTRTGGSTQFGPSTVGGQGGTNSGTKTGGSTQFGPSTVGGQRGTNSGTRTADCQALPRLPSAHFDAEAKELRFDEDQVQSYCQEFLNRLGYQNSAGDLPAYLRKVADILEKAKK